MRNSPSLTTMVFLLILAGMAFVYHKGVTTDIGAASAGARSIIGELQYRDPITGNPEGYPIPR